MKKIFVAILILFSSFFLVACKNEPINGINKINPSAVVIETEDNIRTLIVGKKLQLKATVYPDNAPQEVIWESNNEAVATVTTRGLVSALASGKVKITAKAGSVSDYVFLTVYDEYVSAEEIKITGPKQVYVDDLIKLNFELYPHNAKDEITWSLDNEENATVDHNGRVFGLKPGTVNIKAQGDVTSASYQINVLARSGNPTQIALKGREHLEAGSSLKLRVLTEPLGALNDVAYTSSDESIATVDSKGNVNGLKAGKVTITATSLINENLKASLEIEIKDYKIDLSDWTNVYKQVIEKTKNSVFGVANYRNLLNDKGQIQSIRYSIGSGAIYKGWFTLTDGSVIYNLDELESFKDVKTYHYYLVTNKHVVKGSDAVKIYLHDIEEEVPAELIQYDDKVDVAVIYFEHDRYLRPLKFADVSNLEAGEHVVAIGNPSGFEYSSSATHGIVSHPKRYIPDDTDGDGISDWDAEYIQHDAAINPGNSGGPLLNLQGEIIGINTLKFASNDIDNMGFSIPSNTVVHLLEYLEKGVVPNRAKLGVTSITIKDLLVSQDPRYPVPEGVTYGLYVIEVVPGSKAALAGVKPGDIILSANTKQLKNTVDVRLVLAEIIVGSGDELVLEVLRAGEIIEFVLVY